MRRIEAHPVPRLGGDPVRDRVFAAGLAKDPADRPQNAAELIALFDESLAVEPPRAPTPWSTPSGSAASESSTGVSTDGPTARVDSIELAASAGRPERDTDRRRLGAIAAAAVVMMAGVAGLVAYSQLGGSDDAGAGDAIAAEDASATVPGADDGSGPADTEPGDGGDGSGETDDGPPTTEPVDLTGTSVMITGVEVGAASTPAIRAALDEFAAENGMTITYDASTTAVDDVAVAVGAGAPPDLAIVADLGSVAGYARAGELAPLPEPVAAAVAENWPGPWAVHGVVDGARYGVPVTAEPKSLIWYTPATFEARGYPIPTTLGEFDQLMATMQADGETPLCVGIESGAATGWVFTDWVEDYVLRLAGPETYDAWIAHEIAFDDPAIVDAMSWVLDTWSTPGRVHADSGSIESTSFADNAVPLVAGSCLMHRQASFFAAFLADSTTALDDESIDVFPFPADDGVPLVVGGLTAVAFDDRPEVWAVLEYLTTARYAERRQTAERDLTGGYTGFLSAAEGLDPALFTPVEQSMLAIIGSADPVRYDASDQMPPAVGSGSFWSVGTRAVAGELSAIEAAEEIEATWP